MGKTSTQKLSFFVYDSNGKRITGKLPVPITLSDADPRSQTSLSTTTLTSGLQIVTVTFKGYGTTATISATVQGTTLGTLSDVTYLPETAAFEPSQYNDNYPLAAALAKNGTIWMRLQGANTDNPGFAQIAKSGSYTIYDDTAVAWGQSSIGGITSDASGNMWSYEDTGNGGYIVRFTQSGVFTHFSLSGSFYNYGIEAMVFGPDKAIWFTDDNSSAGRITQNGTVTAYTLPDYNTPSTIVVGPDRNLWIADGYTIVKLTTAGALTPYKISQLPQGAGDFCVGKDGNFWSIMPPGLPPSIVTFNTNGQFVASYPANIGKTYAVAQGCAMDSSGNLYYGDPITGSVGRAAPDGTVVEWPLVPVTNAYPNPDTTTINAQGTLFYGDNATQFDGGFGKVNPAFW